MDNDQIPLRFAERFLSDLVGSIVKDPVVAITEIVANAYDAGATDIWITWTGEPDSLCSFQDNGIGLSREQFEFRWGQFSYSRHAHQPGFVRFPQSVGNLPKRTPFGRNGKGRWAPFCFSDEYLVSSDVEGTESGIVAEVRQTGNGDDPVILSVRDVPRQVSHGTKIAFNLHRGFPSATLVRTALENKFLSDPTFRITLNGEQLVLEGLPSERGNLIETELGEVKIWVLNSERYDRTSNLRGLSFIRSTRMVGEPKWTLPGGKSIKDARSQDGRRFTFVVELPEGFDDHILSDWSGFKENSQIARSIQRITDFVDQEISAARAESNRKRKFQALLPKADALRELPALRRQTVGKFIDELMASAPNISEDDLGSIVSLVIKMESAKTGFQLINKLQSLHVDDLDGWARIIEQWSAHDAEVILTEIGDRIKLLNTLEKHIRDKEASELHVIHPLIASSLWIFGANFESVEFISNRTLQKVLTEYFGDDHSFISRGNRRPDIVVTPDSSASLHARDAYDGAEPIGIGEILLIELKKGASTIHVKEIRQAEDYIEVLSQSKSLSPDVRIEAVVLGWKVDPLAKERTIGTNIRIRPLAYDRLIASARARLFHLQEVVRELSEQTLDAEIEAVLEQKSIDDIE